MKVKKIPVEVYDSDGNVIETFVCEVEVRDRPSTAERLAKLEQDVEGLKQEAMPK